MAAVRNALILSFSVYLLPVVGRHGFWFWGYLLWREITAGEERREVLWLAADLGLAVLLQLTAALIFFWILWGRDYRRWFAIAAAVPVFGWTLNWAYMLAIPTSFLIAPEAAPERADWEVACTVPDTFLRPVRSGAQLELALAREAWLERLPERRYAVLTMPGCRVRDLELTAGTASGGLDYVASGGAVLYRTWDKASGKQGHWFLHRDGGAPVSLAPPDEKYWLPVLSADASAIAWLKTQRTPDGSGFAYTVWIRELQGGTERAVRLGAAASKHPQLIAFDAAKGELVVATDSEQMLGLDLEGELRWGPVRIPEIGHLSDNFRRYAKGWLAWDGPGEDGPFRVAWSLILGAGQHQVLKGRAITSIALDPWSRYIVISVSPHLSIGQVRDAVYVLRVHDGAEVYRRYLAPYSRAAVAFLGPHFLALTRYDDKGDKLEARIEVVRVPGPTPIDQVRRWVNGYRKVVRPLLPLYEKFDGEGLGAEDCGPLHQAQDAAEALSAAPDPVTAETYRVLRARLDEAVFQCDRWDPGPFSSAITEIEFLMANVEDSLVYEHGLEAVPEAAIDGPSGFSVKPVTGADGTVRTKRFRSAGD
jgi:hypothetical protein